MQIPTENVARDFANPSPMEFDLKPCDADLFESVMQVMRRKFGKRPLTVGQLEIIRSAVAEIQDQFR